MIKKVLTMSLEASLLILGLVLFTMVIERAVNQCDNVAVYVYCP